MSPPVYFLSDAHLGAEPKDRETARRQRLHAFLESLMGQPTTLYIVGDLFDFWFEYETAIPRALFETLGVLRRLRESGVELVYLNGNHDFWLGPFLKDEIGVRPHDGALTLELQGRRVWVHHGDGLVGGDLGYRVLKRVIRNPLSIGLYRWLHPDLGIPLAHRVSHLSRDQKGERPLEPEKLWAEIALPRFAAGFDSVVIGHFHHAYERREPGKEFFILGDWMKRFTYLTLESGVFSLKTWPER